LLLRTSVDDRPGGLAGLVDCVAETGASVLDLLHRRAMWRVPVDVAGVELALEVRDEAHAQIVIDYLNARGYHCEREGRGDWPV
jgi:threonine dehydratase